MERKVESMVTQQFLFLMSNVVSKRWSSRTTTDKIRAIKVCDWQPRGLGVLRSTFLALARLPIPGASRRCCCVDGMWQL